MVWKKKVGKQRKDKFYQLAKDTGYRSRAAFKLIQLNRRFSFLEKSRVCIDLCAAPGGWMQVARKNMPVSSIIVGVDLVAIQPIPGCIGLQGDITMDETAKKIEKELKTWKADLVLHDGAPNVGKNWLADAYSQNCLTLSALKVATKFLRGGGWFITKIFRSKDYNALVWVLKQLFKKVHATKPSASRTESAEIFVACEGYVAPDRLDSRFLDPQYVFEELELDPKNKVTDIMHPERQKKARAEGYAEGDYTHHKTITAKQFIQNENGIEALAGLAEIVLEDDEINKHPKTTAEIRECCKDIKVLGRKDLRTVLAWWKAVRQDLMGKIKVENDDGGGLKEEKDVKDPIDEEELEMDELSKQIQALTEEELAAAKRKRKKTNRERQKLHERMNLKMVIKGDVGPVDEGELESFNLQSIKTAQELAKMTEQAPEVVAESDQSEDETPKPKKAAYGKEQSHLDKSGMFYTEEESELEYSSEDEDHEPDLDNGLGLTDSDDEMDSKKQISKTKKTVRFVDTEPKVNPLVTDLDPRNKKDKRAEKAQLWFEKDSFKHLVNESDEDYELDQLVEQYHKKGGKIYGTNENEKKRPSVKISRYESDEEDGDKQPLKEELQAFPDEESEDEVEEENNSDSDSENDTDVEQSSGLTLEKRNKKQVEKDGFEIVPQEKSKKSKKLRLDEEGLAIGALMVSSAKTKRDIIDEGWNRYSQNDPPLPDWFVEDESKHNRKNVPLPKELIEEYKKKMQEINIRPIKKVIEAKARKKKRALAKLKKAQKKMEDIMENADVSDKEKAKQIRQLYKKAQDRRKEVNYVVAKKNGATRRVRRPKGVKGPFRVVDPRMKKDHRKAKVAFKKQGKKGKSTLPANKAVMKRMKQIQKVYARHQQAAQKG